MTLEDMIHVWNRVWIIDNPWIEDKRTIDSWDKIPYLPKDWDARCGSLMGDKMRKKWAEDIPDKVQKVRQQIGENETYKDALINMRRYMVSKPAVW
ncbi:unnamed protein product [Gordionus sp. m RMFG-2023]